MHYVYFILCFSLHSTQRGCLIKKNCRNQFQTKHCLEDLGLEIKITLEWFMQTRDVNSGLDLFPWDGVKKGR
jgi:hypothetical protein